MMILKTEKASKIYQGEKSSAMALNQVSLGFLPEEKVLLYGKSGSGKSTLLKVLSGEEKVTYGKVFSSFSPLYVPSDGKFLENFSAQSNLYYWLRGKGFSRRKAREETRSTLARVGLTSVGHRKAKHLSGGERNRLAIARALALKPKIVLFDEITANLDKENRKKMVDLIFSELSSSLLIFASHDLDLLKGRCTREIEIKQGEVGIDSSPAPTEEITRAEQDKKHNGMVLGARMFFKKTSRILLFALSSLLIGLVGAISSYLASGAGNSIKEEKSYLSQAPYHNRLISGGKETFPNAEYIDSGSLLSDTIFTASLTSRPYGGLIVANSCTLQPLMPQGEKLLIGKKEASDGFYLCISGKYSVNLNTYKDYLDQEYRLYQDNQFESPDGRGVPLRFRGIYQVKESSFSGGPDHFLYLPKKSLFAVRDYTKDLLDEYCENQSQIPVYTSLLGAKEILVRSLTDKLSLLNETEAEKRLEEDLPLARKGLILSEEMKGKKWEITYRSCTFTSASGDLEAYYSKHLRAGEAFLSIHALKRSLVNLSLASSGYYRSKRALKQDLKQGSAALYQADLLLVKPLDISLYLSLLALAGIIVEGLFTLLGLLMLLQVRKGIDEEIDLAKEMGFSSLSLRLPGVLYSMLFTLLVYLLSAKVLTKSISLLPTINWVLLFCALGLSALLMLGRRKKNHD